MITAIVRYRLPATIGKEDCRAHFQKIAKSFADIPGLIRKQFIWNENGTAGGVYQWTDRASAEAFYHGPWLNGIQQRYGCLPEIEYFTTFAITDNPQGVITIPD